MGNETSLLYHHSLATTKGVTERTVTESGRIAANMVAVLKRMEAAGFVVEPDGARLVVSPASKLTPAQRDWLTRNKAELLATLAALADPNVRQLVAHFDAEAIAVYPINTGVGDEDGDTTPTVYTRGEPCG